MGVVITAVGALGLSFIYVATRRMKQVNFAVIQFHYGWSASVICFFGLIVQYWIVGVLPFSGVTWSTWLQLIGASMCNFLAQNIMTLSNQGGSPASISLIVYFQVFYNYLADLLFFEVSFSKLQYLGMAITVGFSLSAATLKLVEESK